MEQRIYKGLHRNKRRKCRDGEGCTWNGLGQQSGQLPSVLLCTSHIGHLAGRCCTARTTTRGFPSSSPGVGRPEDASQSPFKLGLRRNPAHLPLPGSWCGHGALLGAHSTVPSLASSAWGAADSEFKSVLMASFLFCFRFSSPKGLHSYLRKA